MPERQHQHVVLPSATLDERAREEIVKSLKRTVTRSLVPGVGNAWKKRVSASMDGGPASRHQVREAMLEDEYVQHVFSLRRILQEQVWDVTAEIVGRQIDDLNAAAQSVESDAGGTLELDPDLEIPKYLQAVDIHAMPTGYWDQATENYDVAAGALYDRGVYLYALGQSGPFGDSRGRSIVFNFFAEQLPELAPRRILDMGCSVGHSLLPYAELYPEAEIWGIDVGPGVLRYGHARAESLGRKIHFSQQNAERTRFPDGHFDLITSHILLHETCSSALPNIFAECWRLLAPGGYMMHAEVPQFEGVDPFMQFMLDYDTYFNNEPFWGAMHDTDLTQLAVEAGFAPEDVQTAYVASGRREGADRTGVQSTTQAAGQLQLTVARKPPE